MSTTIYARVQQHIKDAVETYAKERGMTIASAVGDLLEKGLEWQTTRESDSEYKHPMVTFSMKVVCDFTGRANSENDT